MFVIVSTVRVCFCCFKVNKWTSLSRSTLSSTFLTLKCIGRKKNGCRCHAVPVRFAVCGGHPFARRTPPRTPSGTTEEDCELFWSRMDREVRVVGTPPAHAPPTHMPVTKMGSQDDPEAFKDLFERTTEACEWPQSHWPVCLILLLWDEAQIAA